MSVKAMCDDVTQFSAQDIIIEYKLGSSANVIRIKEALENKEIIDTLNKEITFLDPLFKRWLKLYYFVSK